MLAHRLQKAKERLKQGFVQYLG